MSNSSHAVIRAQAQTELARLRTVLNQVASDSRRPIDQRVRVLTCNGTRPLTRTQIDHLALEGSELSPESAPVKERATV